MPSIVDGFCQLPSPASVAASVVTSTCFLARTAVQASPAAKHEDEQNDSMLATIPDGPRGVIFPEQMHQVASIGEEEEVSFVMGL